MGRRRSGDAPAQFDSVRKIETRINAYFKKCMGEMLVDEETGRVTLDKKGKPVYANTRPPTLSGLALALGFTSKAEMLGFQGKPEIEAAIMRGRSRIEQYAEEQLFDKECSAGAKFVLEKDFGAQGLTDGDGADDDLMDEVRALLDGDEA